MNPIRLGDTGKAQQQQHAQKNSIFDYRQDPLTLKAAGPGKDNGHILEARQAASTNQLPYPPQSGKTIEILHQTNLQTTRSGRNQSDKRLTPHKEPPELGKKQKQDSGRQE